MWLALTTKDELTPYNEMTPYCLQINYISVTETECDEKTKEGAAQ